MSIRIEPFGTDALEHRIDKITMTNSHGASVSLLNFGVTIQSVIVPDQNGEMKDVCLGFDTLDGYQAKGNGYIGATVGRYANRIAGAQFVLNGEVCHLTANEGKNTLHGGDEGFDKKFWVYETTEGQGRDFVAFYLLSHDGEGGFPGKVRVQVVYSFDDSNRLEVNYLAETNRDTVLNLCNHSYFNLNGEGDALEHELMIPSNFVAETGDDLIPTGWLMETEGTPYDLRTFTRLKDAIDRKQEHPLMARDNGFDISYDLPGEGLHLAAVLRDPISRRQLTVETDQPAMQLYTGQGLRLKGKGQHEYGPYAGIALETQHHPDAVNQEAFECPIVTAQQPYHRLTVYTFGVY